MVISTTQVWKTDVQGGPAGPSSSTAAAGMETAVSCDEHVIAVRANGDIGTFYNATDAWNWLNDEYEVN